MVYPDVSESSRNFLADTSEFLPQRGRPMGISRTWLIGIVAISVCILLTLSAPATSPSLNEQLLSAAEAGSLERVKSLLAKGADVNAKNPARRPGSHCGCQGK